jgi:GNAT superfamily N-acetyltransferase
VKVQNLNVDFNTLTIEHLPQDFDPGDFDCGESDYNDYLRDGTAQRDESANVTRTYLAFFEGVLIGYFAILNDAIPLDTGERPEDVAYSNVPALKIGRLATDTRFQGQGVGKYLITVVIGLAKDLSEQLGCRYVTLDALPQRVTYYTKLGFKRNKVVHRNFRKLREQELENTSMRFDIRDTLK